MGIDNSILVGRTISELMVNEHESSLRFVCSDGHVVNWGVDGDCCSEAWWADITGMSALVQGSEDSFAPSVVRVAEIELPHIKDNRSRQIHDEIYGMLVETQKGAAIFAFRNSSNGYYGGWATEISGETGCTFRKIDMHADEWSA